MRTAMLMVALFMSAVAFAVCGAGCEVAGPLGPMSDPPIEDGGTDDGSIPALVFCTPASCDGHDGVCWDPLVETFRVRWLPDGRLCAIQAAINQEVWIPDGGGQPATVYPPLQECQRGESVISLAKNPGRYWFAVYSFDGEERGPTSDMIERSTADTCGGP